MERDLQKGLEVEIIAHRGAPNEALENSMEAFNRAVEGGATRIEFDVQLLSDGNVVVLHDETLDRTTTGLGRAYACNAQDISAIKLKNQEEIPFLEGVISDFLPKLQLNIELKFGGLTLVDEVLKRLPPIDIRPHKVIISSFDISMLAYLSEEAPDEILAVLWDGKGSISDISRWMTQCKSHILHPEVKYVSQELMTLCKQNRWKVFPYISNKDEGNQEQIWQSMLDFQVDGLCTNYPRELTQWLKGKK